MEKKRYKLLFALIRSALYDCKLSEDERGLYCEGDLPALIALAKEHDVAHLAAVGLDRCALAKNAELDSLVMMSVYRYATMRHELENLSRILEEARLEFIPLKGAVMRTLYPEPWMRTSCDIDVLVRAERLDDAIAAFVTEGYTQGNRTAHDITMISPGANQHIELHFDLLEVNGVMNADSILRDVWNHAHRAEGSQYRYVLSDDMFYFYHIAHMAKHFQGGGCGIRPFIDLMILSRSECDNTARSALIEAGGLTAFEAQARALASVWLQGVPHTEATALIEEFIMSSGVYGRLENRIAAKQIKRGGKLGFIISRLWLPYSSLCGLYPSLKGKKILLPFYQIRRWFSMLFKGGFKRSMEEVRVNNSITEQKCGEVKRVLNLMGIDN